MSSFVFNGISSDSLDLMVTESIIRPTWEREVDYTAIPGRAQVNTSIKSWYSNAELTVKTFVTNVTPQKMRNIYSALNGNTGVLVISTAPQERINIVDVRLPTFNIRGYISGNLAITFVCAPFAESTTEATADITNATSTPSRVDNSGTIYADPEITIIPSAARTDINCNGKVIFVTTPTAIVAANYPANAKVVLDCNAQLAYYQIGDGDKISCTQNTHGAFPRLNVGENYFLTTPAQAVALKYRERWL